MIISEIKQMKKNIGRVGIFFLFVNSMVFLYQCGSSNSPSSPSTPDNGTVIADPSFSQDIQSIFNSSCAVSGCHNGTAQAGLNLSQGVAYVNIVNVNSSQVPGKKRVLPGDAQSSYLVEKIEGRQSAGLRMPLNRGALNNTQIQNIRNWIDRGAKDN